MKAIFEKVIMMREFNLCPFNIEGKLDGGESSFELASIDGVERWLEKPLSNLQKDALRGELEEGIFQEIRNGNVANPLIMFDEEHDGVIPIVKVFFNVSNVLVKFGLAKKTTGISVGLISADGKILFVRRSMFNGGNKGCPGPVAGFMKHFHSGQTLEEVITDNFLEECKHEVGIDPSEISELKIFGYLSMETQDEVMVAVKTTIDSDEILGRARENNGETDVSTSKLAEKDVAFATPEQMISLLSDSEIRGYDAHLACLLLTAEEAAGVNATSAWDNLITLPKQDQKEVYSNLTELMFKYDIKIDFQA